MGKNQEGKPERAFCGVTWARTLVFNGVLGDEAFMQTSASAHSRTDWQAFWLRKAQPSSFFWALQQLPACFPRNKWAEHIGPAITP